jgi:hypothetical protein
LVLESTASGKTAFDVPKSNMKAMRAARQNRATYYRQFDKRRQFEKRHHE